MERHRNLSESSGSRHNKNFHVDSRSRRNTISAADTPRRRKGSGSKQNDQRKGSHMRQSSFSAESSNACKDSNSIKNDNVESKISNSSISSEKKCNSVSSDADMKSENSILKQMAGDVKCLDTDSGVPDIKKDNTNSEVSLKAASDNQISKEANDKNNCGVPNADCVTELSNPDPVKACSEEVSPEPGSVVSSNQDGAALTEENVQNSVIDNTSIKSLQNVTCPDITHDEQKERKDDIHCSDVNLENSLDKKLENELSGEDN